jgi:hypothetical protein
VKPCLKRKKKQKSDTSLEKDKLLAWEIGAILNRVVIDILTKKAKMPKPQLNRHMSKAHVMLKY